MEKVELSTVKKNESERLILISVVGLLESLEQGVITIQDTMVCLFTPFSVNKLKEQGLSPDVIEILEYGCELEDIESLFPTKLENNIKELKEKALQLLVEVNNDINKEIYGIKRWLDSSGNTN